MKIAILSFYSGHVARGIETWTHQLANRLGRKHEIWVFQNGEKLDYSKYRTVSTGLKIDLSAEEYKKSLFRRVFVDYRSRIIAVFTLLIIPTLWREKFDIIIPTSGGWQPAFIRILTWLRGGRMVIVGHTGIGWDEKNNVFSFPDVFVGLSSYAKRSCIVFQEGQ